MPKLKIKHNQKGFVLAATIIAILFASVAAAGVTIFVFQRLWDSDARQRNLRCIYLAEAGIQKAVYNFRVNGNFSLIQENIDTKNYFVLSAESPADLLMIDTSSSLLNPTNTISGWNFQYGESPNTITLASMVVSWSGVGNPSWRLSAIWLNNRRVWRGNAKSGATETVNFSLNTKPALISSNSLVFNKDMTGAMVTVQLNLKDSLGNTAIPSFIIYPHTNGYNSFTLDSLGRTVGAVTYRKMRATYNHTNNKITNYYEIR